MEGGTIPRESLTEYQLPHSDDSERALLCCLFRNPDIFDDALIRSDFFCIPAHQIILIHLLDAFQEHGSKDFSMEFPLFKETFASLKEIADGGGFEYMSSIAGFIPFVGGWRDYYDIVLENFQRRKIGLALINLVQKVFDKDLELGLPFQEFIEKTLTAIALDSPMDDRPYKELAREHAEAIRTRQQTGELIEPSAIRSLNLAMGFLTRGDLLTIGAPTSAGKSTLALHMAEHSAFGPRRLKVAIFSLEMSSQLVSDRLFSAKATIPMKRIRDGELTEEDNRRLDAFIASLPEGQSLMIDDTDTVDIRSIVSKCRRLKARHGLDMVVLDYLQLIESANRRSRETEISDVALLAKQLARQLNVVVIALSQLNEAGQLRESRAIGHHSDFVLILQEPDGSEMTSEREIVIDKARNALRGQKVKVDFFGEYVSFCDKS
jgi:replicative DNA helicase